MSWTTYPRKELEEKKMRKRKRVYLFRHPKDELQDLTVCRNCGRPEEYGKLINNTGHDACSECYDSLVKNIDHIRATDYDRYRDADHLYIMSDNAYFDRCVALLEKQKGFIEEELAKVHGVKSAKKGYEFDA